MKIVLFSLIKNRRYKTVPRPRKCRKVCCLPKSNLFGPVNALYNSNNYIKMTVEEYETIRLIDLEGMMQEECADKMGVARTTVQRIYNDARKKLAQCLVEGKLLKIEGGDYKLCDIETNEDICSYRYCHKHRYR